MGAEKHSLVSPLPLGTSGRYLRLDLSLLCFGDGRPSLSTPWRGRSPSSNIYLVEHMYVLLPLNDVMSKTSTEVPPPLHIPLQTICFPVLSHKKKKKRKKRESRRSPAFCLTSIISNKTNSAR